MFAEEKKNFYSVNADIAIDANQQQRHFEFQSRAMMLNNEYNTAMAMSSSLMGGANGAMSNNEDSQQMYNDEQMNEQAQLENEFAEQHQMQVIALEE